eukprot:3351466-Pyramimonas_sp.AAC.1
MGRGGPRGGHGEPAAPRRATMAQLRAQEGGHDRRIWPQRAYARATNVSNVATESTSDWAS